MRCMDAMRNSHSHLVWIMLKQDRNHGEISVRDLKIPQERHPEKAHRPDNAQPKKPDWIRSKLTNSKEFFLTKIAEKVVWAENSDIDSEVVIELKKGIKLKVLAPDNAGEYSLDTFSLKGFTAAYNHMLKLCNFR